MTTTATSRPSEVLADIDTIPLIDADAHISEPADLWTSRVSKKWGDLVPHVKHTGQRAMNIGMGGESGLAWFMGDQMLSAAPAGAAARDEMGMIPPDKPKDYEDTHPASYDAKARLELLNSEGIWAQAIYPNVAGFGAQAFLKVGDPELRIELVKAYNDFLREWASVAPERFILNAALPFWDLKESMKELVRCKEMGFRGILFASRPNVHGQPWIAESYWDPMWELISDLDLAINFHIGSGQTEDFWKPWPGMQRRTIFTAACTLIFLSNATSLVELTLSGVLQRYPRLKFVSVESGIGFVPFVMEAMDHEFNACQMWKEQPEFEELPSYYFKRQIYSCFWFEESGPKHLIPYCGEDRVLFETDFPHTTKLYPASHVRDVLEKSMVDISPEVRRKVLSKNAADLYHVKVPADMSWRRQPVS